MGQYLVEQLADKTGRRIRYEANYRPKDEQLAKIFDALVSNAREINNIERQRAASIRDGLISMRQLAKIPLGVPLNPRLHLIRSEAFQALSHSETVTSEQASSILNLIQFLRALSQSLSAYEGEG